MEPEDLLKALRQAAAGDGIKRSINAGAGRQPAAPTAPPPIGTSSQLTPRERDILKLIAQGLPNKMIARRMDITESNLKVHVKHMLKKGSSNPAWKRRYGIPPGRDLLRRVRPGDAWRGKLDQRLGQRQGDLIGGDALLPVYPPPPRQAPAVRGARFHCSTRHNDAPAIGAAGIYRRRQAEGLGVSLPVQRLMPCRLWICSFNCTVSPDCRSQGGVAR